MKPKTRLLGRWLHAFLWFAIHVAVEAVLTWIVVSLLRRLLTP